MNKAEAIYALRQLIAFIGGEPDPPSPPEPPPGPDPSRSTMLMKVIVDECVLRFIDHLNLGGGALWGIHPKQTTNPHRDRFFARRHSVMQVYTDRPGILWGKYKGAQKGNGGAHAWEVCEGQMFVNKAGEFAHRTTGHPTLFILCRDVKRI